MANPYKMKMKSSRLAISRWRWQVQEWVNVKICAQTLCIIQLPWTKGLDPSRSLGNNLQEVASRDSESWRNFVLPESLFFLIFQKELKLFHNCWTALLPNKAFLSLFYNTVIGLDLFIFRVSRILFDFLSDLGKVMWWLIYTLLWSKLQFTEHHTLKPRALSIDEAINIQAFTNMY